MAKQLGGCERISGQKDKKDLLQLGGGWDSYGLSLVRFVPD